MKSSLLLINSVYNVLVFMLGDKSSVWLSQDVLYASPGDLPLLLQRDLGPGPGQPVQPLDVDGDGDARPASATVRGGNCKWEKLSNV